MKVLFNLFQFRIDAEEIDGQSRENNGHYRHHDPDFAIGTELVGHRYGGIAFLRERVGAKGQQGQEDEGNSFHCIYKWTKP